LWLTTASTFTTTFITPEFTGDRRITALKDVADDIYRVTNVALAIAVGVATARIIRCWWIAALEDIADDIDGVTDIDLTVAIGVTRQA
jgi:hypothetical protein